MAGVKTVTLEFEGEFAFGYLKGEKLTQTDSAENASEQPKQGFEESKKHKPDYLDMDKDGNKKESMKKAIADKKKKHK